MRTLLHTAALLAEGGLPALLTSGTAIVVYIFVILTAIAAIHRLSPIESITASTYQAVSGAGAGGQTELEEQIKAIAAGKAVHSHIFPIAQADYAGGNHEYCLYHQNLTDEAAHHFIVHKTSSAYAKMSLS